MYPSGSLLCSEVSNGWVELQNSAAPTGLLWTFSGQDDVAGVREHRWLAVGQVAELVDAWDSEINCLHHCIPVQAVESIREVQFDRAMTCWQC